MTFAGTVVTLDICLGAGILMDLVIFGGIRASDPGFVAFLEFASSFGSREGSRGSGWFGGRSGMFGLYVT